MNRIGCYRKDIVAIVAAALAATACVCAGAEQAGEDSSLDALVQLLAQVDEPQFQLDVLMGIRQGLSGRKRVKMPRNWPAVYTKLAKSPQSQVRQQAMLLALIFGDRQAAASLRRTMMDPAAPLPARRTALEALVERKTPELAPLLHKLVDERTMRGPALRGMGAYKHPDTPEVIFRRYAVFGPAEQQDAISTLASRAEYALAMLSAVEEGRLARRDLSAFTARQLQNFADKRVNEKLAKVWGAVRRTSQDKKALIANYKSLLTDDYLKMADLGGGRLVYTRTCMQCHALYGVGGKIGPDLTGSNRANLDYVLENVLDPGAVIGKDYQLTNVITTDGRLISGIVQQSGDKSVTIQTVNQRVVLPREDIDQMRLSPLSMMPEGQFDKLKKEEIRDLVAYLAAKTQVPLPSEKNGQGNK